MQGLDLLRQLPLAAKSLRAELDMLLILGEALIYAKGDSAPETGHVYRRAMGLCQQVATHSSNFAPWRDCDDFMERDDLKPPNRWASSFWS